MGIEKELRREGVRLRVCLREGRQRKRERGRDGEGFLRCSAG